MDETKTDGTTVSSPALRVLILEDSPRDAKLTASVLEGGGVRVQFEVTDSGEFFRKSLEKAEYDVVLADFNLRNWTAFDALDILKRSGKDIPLLVVTGSLGDEAAVECIKQGAADFVLKDRPARLPTAVQRALEEKRLRTENQRAFESISRLATIVESSDDAIIGTTLEGVTTSWNIGAEKLYGYSATEVLGQPISVLVPPGRSEEVAKILAGLGNGARIEQFETVRVRRDGSLVNVSLSMFPLTDSRGEVTGAASIARDITERQRMEEALRASEIQFRRLFETAKDGILILDADTGEIKDVNPFLSDLLDFPRADLLGKKLWEIGPLQDALLSKTSFEDLQSKGYVRYEHLPLETRNGKRIEVEFVSNVYNVNQLKVIQCNIRDITERKRAQEALEKRTRELAHSREALERKAQELTRSNAELQQFAYVASHDLQEPLRTMASFAQLLQKRYQGKLDASADDFIHFIVDGAARMQGLISDLLAYSRVGSRGEDFVPTDCSTVFDEAVANLHTAIAESGAVVTHDPLPTVPCHREQLVQVFQNLIGNAVKFRDSQPPRVHVAAEQRPSDWLFSVQDNGIGIDPQYAQRIFEVFQRLHNRTEYPGSGIGLAVAKKIVERHGGLIWVESQPHQGATFFFTLPG